MATIIEIGQIGLDKPQGDQVKISQEVARSYEINVRTEIHDSEKGTRKTKEMQNIIATLQDETKALISHSMFDVKAKTKQITELVEVFAETGGTLVKIFLGSIVFVVRFDRKEDLQKLWKMYRTDSLKEKLKTTLITESIGKRVYKKLGINIDIDEKAYKKGMKFFSKDKDTEVQATTPSLCHYLADAKQSITNADNEIQKLNEEIRERCDRLGTQCATRAEIKSTMVHNLEKVAAKITFDVSGQALALTEKVKAVKQKAKEADDQDDSKPVKKKAKKANVDSALTIKPMQTLPRQNFEPQTTASTVKQMQSLPRQNFEAQTTASSTVKPMQPLIPPRPKFQIRAMGSASTAKSMQSLPRPKVLTQETDSRKETCELLRKLEEVQQLSKTSSSTSSSWTSFDAKPSQSSGYFYKD